MDLKITIRKNAPALRHFPEEVLIDLVRSFHVQTEPGDVIVYHGSHPPVDTSKKWQPLDTYGAPMGWVKSWNGGSWV